MSQPQGEESINTQIHCDAENEFQEERAYIDEADAFLGELYSSDFSVETDQSEAGGQFLLGERLSKAGEEEDGKGGMIDHETGGSRSGKGGEGESQPGDEPQSAQPQNR